MRAIELAEYGGPEVLKTIAAEDPVPDAGHVLIDVAVSGIQSLDTYLRRGRWTDFFPTTLPYIPGMEAAGVVSAADDPSWIGRRVLASLPNGGYATHVVAPVDKVVPVPDELDLRDAMALLHDGSTALSLLEETPVQAGETVLVQPAAGGLGTVLVQLLAASGARVIGAARGASKLALVRELGADVVVDYSAPDWLSQVGTVDIVFDGVGGSLGQAAIGAVRDGGRYSNYGNASGSADGVTASGGISVRGIDQLGTFRTDNRGRILDLAAAGKIRAVIGRTWPLDQAAEAHRAVEAREVLGKALLIPR
ncbi:zinc-binding dehydrogenase [Kibdelosporangium philippinense]|uniref:Zinc-binding dehydrogenase n=1 Tax=Kibdelosporangium philippinense TaxID=211113 RepID=A0ABS8ZEN9_9PSEU|nr:zinc-binding dehydrogenase [Kibdelosporangium philippinense]MCE7006289.1 zinc-binding dehydrogenase [Kibdelosporangium philippinense]